MGVVYLGRDPVIGRLVALKTIRAVSEDDVEQREFQERFLREAQAAGILSHPNIVTVHDVGEDSATETSFIAMEYVEGKNLKQLLSEKTPFSSERVAEIVGQVAEALDYAHRRGIVHRDVKPANIIITPEGQVKITDFGIAKTEKSNLTTTGQFLGTPNYMSPEQVTGDAVDGRSDLFSLGVVLYELLTRKKPFSADNLTSISYKIVHEQFVPPETYDASIPPEFADGPRQGPLEGSGREVPARKRLRSRALRVQGARGRAADAPRPRPDGRRGREARVRGRGHGAPVPSSAARGSGTGPARAATGRRTLAVRHPRSDPGFSGSTGFTSRRGRSRHAGSRAASPGHGVRRPVRRGSCKAGRRARSACRTTGSSTNRLARRRARPRPLLRSCRSMTRSPTSTPRCPDPRWSNRPPRAPAASLFPLSTTFRRPPGSLTTARTVPRRSSGSTGWPASRPPPKARPADGDPDADRTARPGSRDPGPPRTRHPRTGPGTAVRRPADGDPPGHPAARPGAGGPGSRRAAVAAVVRRSADGDSPGDSCPGRTRSRWEGPSSRHRQPPAPSSSGTDRPTEILRSPFPPPAPVSVAPPPGSGHGGEEGATERIVDAMKLVAAGAPAPKAPSRPLPAAAARFRSRSLASAEAPLIAGAPRPGPRASATAPSARRAGSDSGTASEASQRAPAPDEEVDQRAVRRADHRCRPAGGRRHRRSPLVEEGEDRRAGAAVDEDREREVKELKEPHGGRGIASSPRGTHRRPSRSSARSFAASPTPRPPGTGWLAPKSRRGRGRRARRSTGRSRRGWPRPARPPRPASSTARSTSFPPSFFSSPRTRMRFRYGNP